MRKQDNKCCCALLVVVQFVQLYLVDERSIAGDVTRSVFSKGKLIREVEAVNATGIHQLQAFDQAREHRVANHMYDWFALAVGLVVGFAGEHQVTAIVESDALCIVCFGAFAFA